MNDVERAKQLLSTMSLEEQQQVLAYLRGLIPKHRVETELMISAEGILDAIARAGDFTVRMIRGVFAEAAFAADVLPTLVGTWRAIPTSGDPPYDFLLTDTPVGREPTPDSLVKLQVKMQRSEKKVPLRANKQWSTRVSWPSTHFIVEVQKSRKGEKAGKSTRPYRFGEFDVLAVSLGPSAGRWSAFMYTLERWLLPNSDEPTQVLTFQPVAPSDNDCWTSDFRVAVEWLRSGVMKRIDGDVPSKRKSKAVRRRRKPL